MKKLLIVLSLVCGCTVIDKGILHSTQVCYGNPNLSNYTSYTAVPNRTTPVLGIQVDDPRGEIDLAQVDQTVINVVKCLQLIADTPMNQQELQENYCTQPADISLKSCLKLRVADWHTSTCDQKTITPNSQIFPCTVPVTSCEEKGESPTPQCPCECRGVPQDENWNVSGVSTQSGNLIVLTPNLELLPQVLTMYMTGCARPFSTRVAACTNPTMIAPKSVTVEMHGSLTINPGSGHSFP